jgi:hypothetical protein
MSYDPVADWRQFRSLDRSLHALTRRKPGAYYRTVDDHVRVDRDESLVRMQEAAALWSIRQDTAAELVEVACDLLVAGFDGLHLAILAGVQRRHADEDVPHLLEAAMQEVGLRYYPRDSQAGLEASVRILALRVLAGHVSPRDLTAWAHFTVGHDRLPLAEGLVELDDVYDALKYTDMTEQDFNDEVRSEARRIVESAG